MIFTQDLIDDLEKEFGNDHGDFTPLKDQTDNLGDLLNIEDILYSSCHFNVYSEGIIKAFESGEAYRIKEEAERALRCRALYKRWREITGDLSKDAWPSYWIQK